jgi:protein TonB
MRNNLDLLNVTAFFSALAHAVIILGVSFKFPEIKAIDNTDNTLDVVLINQSNDIAPDQSETVSTSNNAGGGNDSKESSSPLPFKVVSPAPIQTIQKQAKKQTLSSVSPDKMVTAQISDVAVDKKQEADDKLKSDGKATDQDKLSTLAKRQLERKRLIAKLNQKYEEYQKRPNKTFLSPSTSKHETAEYLDKWRKKIVVIGNANYPPQATAKGVYGTLILTVEINRNGTLHAVHINQPSEHKLLNDAAMRFVRDASPFDAFPDNIDAETDILVITRAFHFMKNNRLTTSDASSQR